MWAGGLANPMWWQEAEEISKIIITQLVQGIEFNVKFQDLSITVVKHIYVKYVIIISKTTNCSKKHLLKKHPAMIDSRHIMKKNCTVIRGGGDTVDDSHDNETDCELNVDSILKSDNFKILSILKKQNLKTNQELLLKAKLRNILMVMVS